MKQDWPSTKRRSNFKTRFDSMSKVKYGKLRLVEHCLTDTQKIYIDETTTKKALQVIIAEVFEQYGEAQTALIADDLKDLGFEYATIFGLSTAITDFNDPKNIDKMVADPDDQVAEISDQFDEGLITEDERYRLTVDAWKKTDKSIEKDFETEDGSMAISIRSGARGNISNLKQITGSLGVVVDATGKEIELPIKSSYKEGFSPLEYFTSLDVRV